MDTQLYTTISVAEGKYEVIGSGEIPKEPTIIGEWWVVPAELYQGKVPKKIQQELFAFINSGIRYKGVLIADDLRKIQFKEEQKKKKIELAQKVGLASAGALVALVSAFIVIAVGLGLAIVTAFFTICAYDPMLIVCLEEEDSGESGRWICLGTWYE